METFREQKSRILCIVKIIVCVSCCLRFSETFRKCIDIDPKPDEGRTLLAMHFITQAVPDVHRQLQKLKAGPQPRRLPWPQGSSGCSVTRIWQKKKRLEKVLKF